MGMKETEAGVRGRWVLLYKHRCNCFYTRYSWDFQLVSGPDTVWSLNLVLCLLCPPRLHWGRESVNYLAGLLNPAVALGSSGISSYPEWQPGQLNVHEPWDSLPCSGLLERFSTAPYHGAILHFCFSVSWNPSSI